MEFAFKQTVIATRKGTCVCPSCKGPGRDNGSPQHFSHKEPLHVPHGQINHIKHALDGRTLITAINALNFRKLFYRSNMWANYFNYNIANHVMPVLKDLNWLQYQARPPGYLNSKFVKRANVIKHTTKSSQRSVEYCSFISN